MLARRLFQSLLALVLCLVLAVDFGVFYFVPAGAAMLIAVSTGVYVLTAIALGLVWPVLAVAFVLHVTSSARLRAQAAHHGAQRSSTTEADGTRIEDP